jgi:2-haloacid dehalogenase
MFELDNSFVSRRQFVRVTATGLIGSVWAPSLAGNPVSNNKFKAIAFDAFAIFDARSVFRSVQNIFPDKANELFNLWRAKQFEYCWLRTVGIKYVNFWKILEDSLIWSSGKLNIELTVENKKLLMNEYLTLEVWPDVIPALKELKAQGIKLGFLSNMTFEMLESCAKHNGLGEYFQYTISTDKVQAFKPSPTAYHLGIEVMNLEKNEILFVAFAGWDSAGAKWFGYPTYWVNRSQMINEELGVFVDGTGNNLGELINFLAIKSAAK